MATFFRENNRENRQKGYDVAERIVTDMLPELTPDQAVGLACDILGYVKGHGFSYADFQSAQHAEKTVKKCERLLGFVS